MKIINKRIVITSKFDAYLSLLCIFYVYYVYIILCLHIRLVGRVLHMLFLLYSTVFDPCRRKPCKNDGVCRRTDSSFTCTCPLYYFGSICAGRQHLPARVLCITLDASVQVGNIYLLVSSVLLWIPLYR